MGQLKAPVGQGVHKAGPGEFPPGSHEFRVSLLDVQTGDVVGQNGDFIGVDFLGVFARQRRPVAAQPVQQFHDKRAGPGAGVENIQFRVGQALAKMPLRQPVAAGEDEPHHFARRVDHAQLVGVPGVVGGVEVLVDRLEKFLFLRRRNRARRRPPNRGVIGFQSDQQVAAGLAAQKGAFQVG